TRKCPVKYPCQALLHSEGACGEGFCLLTPDPIAVVSFQYPKRMRVISVTDSDLYGHDITNHPTVKQALRRFEPSSMAVVCGPDYVVDRVQRYLSNTQGYPQDHIASIKF